MREAALVLVEDSARAHADAAAVSLYLRDIDWCQCAQPMMLLSWPVHTDHHPSPQYIQDSYPLSHQSVSRAALIAPPSKQRGGGGGGDGEGEGSGWRPEEELGFVVEEETLGNSAGADECDDVRMSTVWRRQLPLAMRW